MTKKFSMWALDADGAAATAFYVCEVDKIPNLIDLCYLIREMGMETVGFMKIERHKFAKLV